MLQAKYPSTNAWTRCKGLLHKTRSSPVKQRESRVGHPLMSGPPARSHLLAPGHAPFAHGRSPLNVPGDALPPMQAAAPGEIGQ